MRRITATDAARRFSDLLDAVEGRGESFVVERRGRAIASIAPAAAVSGRTLKQLLRSHRVDSRWPDELRELRSALTTEERHWSG